VVEEEEVAFFHPLERRAVPAVVVDGPQTDFVEVGERVRAVVVLSEVDRRLNRSIEVLRVDRDQEDVRTHYSHFRREGFKTVRCRPGLSTVA